MKNVFDVTFVHQPTNTVALWSTTEVLKRHTVTNNVRELCDVWTRWATVRMTVKREKKSGTYLIKN